VSTELNRKRLINILQLAYSGERAAGYAYRGHWQSVSDPNEKARIKTIEDEEWHHRELVGEMLATLNAAPNKWREIRATIIGHTIGVICHLSFWFVAMYGAGKLESGNVCEYFVMMHYFHSLGIRDHDAILYEMGMKEKEHEAYFLDQIKDSRLLPFFERVFSWGRTSSLNDVHLGAKHAVADSHRYCTTSKISHVNAPAKVGSENR